ncbi:hypothetical protein FG385_31200 [Amycolatopsis alkalitolerans]|uniref:Transmembrane protein n=1 Tax=Amycolatopsis alkalitolerans TaxID=2547244 RepID=A0A5C4LVS9_9PSEU|nr:hypothetical protein FG385_31200 [Amycolatopsis alkalitolerans]
MARFWRRIHLGRNPLARRSDRVEGVVLLVVVLGLLIALPIAALIGSKTYRGQLAVSAEQRASRHAATATLLEDAPSPVPATDGAYPTAGGTSGGVHASWPLPDGTQRTGTVGADSGATAGTHVPVWLSDSTGDPVPAPMTPSDAATTSVLAGIFSWLVAALGLAAVYWTIRLILDRRRATRWDREWMHAGDRWARS